MQRSNRALSAAFLISAILISTSSPVRVVIIAPPQLFTLNLRSRYTGYCNWSSGMRGYRMVDSVVDPAEQRLEIVRSFVNTVELDEPGSDSLGSAEGLSSWIAEHGLGPSKMPVDETDIARAVALREALRNLLSANAGEKDDAEAWEVLNAQALRSPLRFQASHGEVSLDCCAEGVDDALGAILATIYRAISDGTWRRLKACRRHTCRWAFYDRSRNRSRSWCSMSVCGNREKVSRFRERSRDDE
jgi:predicted RNA-binding Zn ribbon-like protein